MSYYITYIQKLSECSVRHYLDLWGFRTLSASVDMATYTIHNLQPLGEKTNKQKETLLSCLFEDTKSSLESLLCY